MSALAHLRHLLAADATILSAEQELGYIQQLRALAPAEVLADLPAFGFVLDALYHSHMDTFYAVDAANYGGFVAFADWLAALGPHLPPGQEVDSAVEMFRRFPRPPFG